MPTDIKLLSTSSVQTLKRRAQKAPQKASSPSSAQDTQQALPCNTHTATQSKPCHRKSTPSLHFLWKQQQKSCSPDTAPGLEVVSLSQQKLQRLQLLMSPEKRCLLQYHSTYCIAFQRSESGCSSRAHMARSAGGFSLFSTIQLQSLSACGGELPALGAGGFWLQRLLTLSIASGVC